MLNDSVSFETQPVLSELCRRFPPLVPCTGSLIRAFEIISEAFRRGGKLLLCGNGGSAADCEHIAGELMKGFLLRRPLPSDFQARLPDTPEGRRIAGGLQGALPCIALTGHPALSTAFGNDADAALTFAQQLYGYGRSGDVLLAISTSGNAQNVCLAALTARAMGISVVGLTGRTGGRLSELCDAAIQVPAEETYQVQEYHLPVYHALCRMLEAAFFSE